MDYNNSDYDFEITKFACDLDKIYGGLDVKRGKADNYFGVELDFSVNKKVQVYMIPSLNNDLSDSP